jgi:hypothetical protein
MAVAGLYFSGQADDLFAYFAKKYYKAEAKAEEKALEKAGTDKAEGFLKGMYLSPRFGVNGGNSCLRAMIDANPYVSRPLEEEPNDGRGRAKPSAKRPGK